MGNRKSSVSAPITRPTPAATTAEDERLAAAAIRKSQSGGKPRREESAALRRVKQVRDEALRTEHFGSIRKREWQRWSGRQQKVLNDQAARYGVPIGERTIDLPSVVYWLHEFLAANARRLSAPDDEDPAIGGASSPALERKRLVDAKRAELRYENELGQSVLLKDVHSGVAVLACVLRTAGEELQREFGPEAHAILNEALDDATTALRKHFDRSNQQSRDQRQHNEQQPGPA